MIIIEEENCFLSVSFTYCSLYISRIKKIPTASYCREKKCWYVNKMYFYNLEQEFYGEIYYKTPRHIILGEVAPNYTVTLKKRYKQSSLLNPLYAPFPYQEYGFQFIRNKLEENSFMILGDGVGLGKTFEVIMTICSLFEEREINKCIILCKKSIKKQWIDEIKKFSFLEKHLEVLEYIGSTTTKKKRDALYEKLKQAANGIIVTTYQSCMHDMNEIDSIGVDIAVIDEAHTIKAVNGVINNSVSVAINKAKYKIPVTGTAITNKPKDLFAIVSICNKDYFGDFKKFEYRYITYSDGKEVGARNLDELRDKCQGIMLRRTEREVDIKMPVVKELNYYYPIDKVQETCMKIIDQSIAEAKSRENSDDIIKGLLRSKQAIANDPHIMKMSKSGMFKKMFDGLDLSTYPMSYKTYNLVKIVKAILASGKKVIIFSRLKRSGFYLKSIFEKYSDHNILLFNGDVKEEERIETIRLFKNSAEHSILIGSDAMAEGVSLACASYVINYDLSDTQSTHNQRTGRVRRADSKEDFVYVVNLLTSSTVDEAVLLKLQNQKNTFNSIVELTDSQSSTISGLSN